MKINVPSIPDEGLHLSLTDADGWFRAVLQERLSEWKPELSAIQARLDLFRTNQNVSLTGKVHLKIEPNCARCGVPFSEQMEIPLLRHLVPHFAGPRENLLTDQEEVELSAEDLDFSFYHNEVINLQEILAEELLLALPMSFICSENCKGLCPHCGKNLNQGNCNCPSNPASSPFAVLKNFKVQS